MHVRGRWIVSGIAVATLVLGAGSAGAVPQTQPYVGGLSYGIFCDVTDGAGGTVNVGGACFDIAADQTEVDITIDDVTTLPVPGWHLFWDTDNPGSVDGYAMFCQSTHVAVPAGADVLTVYVQGPITSPTADLIDDPNWDNCLDSHGSPAFGTAGTITVE